MLLEGKGLRFEYPAPTGPVLAVDGIDLELEGGELRAVIGPNGSGKSTLLKLLGGQLSPCAGRVSLAGADLGGLSARERAQQIAVVPQHLRALPDTTVERFVAGGRYAHRRRWSRPDAGDLGAIERALAVADADRFVGRLLGEPGGEQQRVLIARALAQQARVLLVDEPTNSLDPEHQIRVFRLLHELVEEGRAVVVVTHDLNLASQFAASIQLLDRGRVAAVGPVEQVLRPEVLEPVYGPDLVFGELPAVEGRPRPPYVLPWRFGPGRLK